MSEELAHRDSVRTFLKKASGRVSEGDVAAGVGIDVGTARSTLYQLMLAYNCTLDVHEDGTVVYDFGAGLVPLNRPSLGERLLRVAGWLWRGFSLVYKASLAVVLVLYALVFVVLIIGAAVAASSASKDDAPVSGAAGLVGAIFRGIFEFATYSTIVYVQEDRYGYRHKHYEPKKPVLPQRNPKPHAKSFIASVYDFVLGPKRVEPDKRAQHREVASFVREHGGALSIADVQSLSGMTRAEAERFFARFVAEFDGEADISDEGALFARFPELQRSASSEHDEPIVHYWDEYEPPFEVTGNTTGKNIGIALLAGFNLLCSLFVLIELGMSGSMLVWLGLVPALMFSLFFAIPMVRAPWVWKQNKRQHRHNINKRLFAAIFKTLDGTVSLDRLVEVANRLAKSEETLDADKIRPLLEVTLREVGGDVELDANNELVVDLSQLRHEAFAREAAAVKVVRGPVAFSTDD